MRYIWVICGGALGNNIIFIVHILMTSLWDARYQLYFTSYFSIYQSNTMRQKHWVAVIALIFFLSKFTSVYSNRYTRTKSTITVFLAQITFCKYLTSPNVYFCSRCYIMFLFILNIKWNRTTNHANVGIQSKICKWDIISI